ncbi:protein kinase domain-containing protein [Nonomuraea longicatena]|uniref:Protein kinase domain-containing protein n=1 Tax=Nonomuraea longicatena TaxID=83682 RepID=A0ABN1QGD8_9ACTN
MSDETTAVIADRYRLEELIGRGAAGEVWRAHDERADWAVAVKILTAGPHTGLTEYVQAVAKVIHPNVAMVLDIGAQDGAPYLVMEYLTGLSLGEELAGHGPLGVVEACDLVGQAASGLDAAHREGIVHGAVDLGSLRRAGGGVLKVTGFGRHPEGAATATPYRAPEQLDGPAVPASDLYALGCVLYELLCSRPPFTGEPDELAALHRGADPEPPTAHRPAIPAELEELILSMLDKDPAARPRSGETVRRRLASIARPGATQRTGPLPAMTDAHGVPVTGLPGSPGEPDLETTDATAATAVHGAPGRAGDTAVYDGPLVEKPADERVQNRRLVIQLVAALAVIGAVTAGFLVLSGRDRPVAAPTSAEPSVPAVTETPSLGTVETVYPTPTPLDPNGVVATFGPGGPDDAVNPPVPRDTTNLRQLPPGGWTRFLSHMEQALSAQQQQDGIGAPLAEETRRRIAEAMAEARQGREEEARQRTLALAADLVRAEQSGELTQGGALSAFLTEWGLRG